MVLDRFYDLYNRLNGTTSRNDKEKILREYCDDAEIKAVLHFIFNPFIVTGISDKKLTKKTCETDEQSEIGLLELLDYFREHNTGRDEDVLYLKKYLNSVNEKYRSLIKSAIKKDITVGASEITLNKVFGAGFIPSFNVMLAEKYSENMEFVEGKRFIITEKLDGVRCMLIFDDNGIPMFFSRVGNAIDGLTELSAEAEQLDKSFVYDGELLLNTKPLKTDETTTYSSSQYVNKYNLSSADLYRATVRVTASDGEKKNLIYNVFDYLPKTDLYDGACPTECEQRKTRLQTQLDELKLPHINAVPVLYTGDEIGKIDELCDKYTDMGKEGVMINIASAPYECKRTKNLLKVKRFNSADVRVLDWEEGTGVNKGKLGAVIVEFIAPDGKTYKCKVGSGFEKEERERLFADPAKIVGHLIEIGYFELSRNQNDDGYSLRFPTFKCIRDDKTEISMH
jgi:DNA ligase-1